MASFVTEAIVTASRKYGEADRLITLLTLEKGRLGAIAKSARKPKSSLRGATEPFVRAEFELAEGKSLDIVRQVEIIDPHLGLRDSWTRLQLAGHVAEIANSMSVERFPDAALYELVCEALREISEGQAGAVLRFKAGLLDHMGVFPDLSGCSNCGSAKVKGDVHLDVKGHGFLCAACAKEKAVYRPVPMKVLYVLHALRNGDAIPDEGEEIRDVAEDALTVLLQTFLQQGFKTSKAAGQARSAENRKDHRNTGKADNKSGRDEA